MTDVRANRPVAFAAVALGALLFTTGPLYRVRTWWSYEDPLADDPWVVAVYIAVALAGALVLATDDRWRAVPRSVGLLGTAFVGWFVLSTVWSLDASRTLRESLFIGGALVAGAAAMTVLTARAAAWAIWVGVQVGLAWSFIAVATDAPGSLFEGGTYAGVYFNRNSLGLYAALGIVMSIVLGVDAARRWLDDRAATTLVAVAALLGALGADTYLLAGTEASTPVGAAAATLVVLAAVPLARRAAQRSSPSRVAAIAGAAAAVVAAAAWITRSSWTGSVGREGDFTGRSDIWDLALERAGDRPLHGFGYLGAWGDPEFVASVEAATTHVLQSSHNAFVEALLGGGIVGLVLVIGFVGAVYLVTVRTALGHRGALAAWPLGMLVFVVAENMTETLVVGNQLTVALLSAAATMSIVDEPAGTPPRRAASSGEVLAVEDLAH